MFSRLLALRNLSRERQPSRKRFSRWESRVERSPLMKARSLAARRWYSPRRTSSSASPRKDLSGMTPLFSTGHRAMRSKVRSSDTILNDPSNARLCAQTGRSRLFSLQTGLAQSNLFIPDSGSQRFWRLRPPSNLLVILLSSPFKRILERFSRCWWHSL